MKLPNYKLRAKYCKYISHCKRLDNFIVQILSLFSVRSKLKKGKITQLKVRFSNNKLDYPVEIQPYLDEINNMFRYQTYPFYGIEIHASHWMILMPRLIFIHRMLQWTISDYDKLVTQFDTDYLRYVCEYHNKLPRIRYVPHVENIGELEC